MLLSEGKARVAVVTGASSGIGLAAACDLLKHGCNVIGLGRTPARVEAARNALQSAAAPGQRFEMLTGDMANMAETADLARQIHALTDRVNLLVNNAGATIPDRRVTADGYEQTFAANHLGPFLLTSRLLDLLRAGGPGARIINVSSLAHSFAKGMDWDDLQLSKGYDEGKAYSCSKLANLLFTQELARRVEADGIIVQAVHPGIVASNFAKESTFMYKLMYAVMKPWVRTPEDAAKTLLWLAEGGNNAQGGYFANCRPARRSKAASDVAAASRLWRVSEELIHRTGA